MKTDADRASSTGPGKNEGVSVLTVAISDFKSGLEKFAAMFSGNYGVKLIFRGTSAFTNGKTIVVPELALLERKNMSDKERKEALDYLMCTRGFVYHEGAHIIYSDFGPTVGSRVARHKGGKKFNQLFQVLEDMRIEQKISKVYPGAKEVLAFTRNFVNSETKKVFVQREANKQPLTPYTHLMYAISLLGNMDKGGRDHPLWRTLQLEARRKARSVRALITEAQHAGTTMALVDVAERLWKALHEKKDEDEPPPPPESGDGEDSEEKEEEEGKDDKKSKKKKKKDKKKSKPDKEKDDPEENEGDESGDDDSEESEDDPSDSDGEGSGETDDADTDDADGGGKDDDEESGGAPGEDDEDTEGDSGGGGADDDEDGETNAEGSGKEDEEGEPDAPGSASDVGDGVGSNDKSDGEADPFGLDDSSNKDELRDAKDALTEKVKEAATLQPPGQYRVYTTEHDFIGPPQEDKRFIERYGDGREFVKLIDEETKAVYGPLKRNLENILKARSLTHTVRGLDSGELDQSNLHTLAQAARHRSPQLQQQARHVFEQRVQARSLLETAVGMTVDRSGSMSGSTGGGEAKDRLAMKCADILGQSLDGVGVPFELSTWSTKGTDSFVQCPDADRQLYTRFSAIHFVLLKAFDDTWREKRANLRHLSARGCNVDGESIWLAAQRLLARREKRKVLFVLSDGEPSGESGDNYDAVRLHLHATTARIVASGIELYAVGIAAPQVRVFYKNFVNVNDARKLPEVMSAHLKQVLHLV